MKDNFALHDIPAISHQAEESADSGEGTSADPSMPVWQLPSFSPYQHLRSSASQTSSDFSPIDRRRTSEVSAWSRASRSSQASLTPAQAHMLKLRRNSKAVGSLSPPEWVDDEDSSDGPQGPFSELLDLDDQLVPTSRCYQEFNRVASRVVPVNVQQEKDAALKASENKRRQHQQTLNALRAWAAAKAETQGIRRIIRGILRRNRTVPYPNKADLVDMARYYYPLRGDIKVHVCDFGKGRFEKQEIPLGSLDIELYSKPEWSVVRWIHAPLNVDLVHASLEDRFLAGGRTGAASHSTNISWPYAQIETMSLRERSELADQRDVKKLLTEYEEFSGVTQELDEIAMEGIGEELMADLNWRAGHYGIKINYWELVASDDNSQLSAGSSVNPFYLQDMRSMLQLDRQSVSNIPFFESAHIIRFPFRCFHRSDGFLLSMVGASGIDFLDARFKEYIKQPADNLYDNEDGSIIGFMFRLFSKTGTLTWHRANLDWFLIYLLTEVAAAPHTIRQGGNAPHLCKAYQSVVRGLKNRRYDKFERNKTVGLVREYLKCIDELTNINTIYAKKLEMLGQLKKKLVNEGPKQPEDSQNNPDGETASARIDWAIACVSEDSTTNQELLADLRESLTALFQLRSIEQNELAIVADTQNRAVLVFTGVTTIFLPLTFITSYYGMNLKGIINTSKSQSYFWTICVTISFGIVLLITLGAFQHRLRSRILRFRINDRIV